MKAKSDGRPESKELNRGFVCFLGQDRIATGTREDIAMAAWRALQADPTNSTLTFNRNTGEVVDLNLSGTVHDVIARMRSDAHSEAKRGRPRLGVVAREITLLPRHWEWLARQPGGASAALRRLIDAARNDRAAEDAKRERIYAAYKFMSAMAGDLPSFEEASRALFSNDNAKLEASMAQWPADIQNELKLFLRK